MDWIELTSETELDQLIENSFETPQAIYKHSTSCGTSFHVKTMLEEAEVPEGMDFHYLDLLAHRTLSNKVAAHFHVHHESPQILIIKEGKCVYHTSHLAIRMDKIKQYVDLNPA